MQEALPLPDGGDHALERWEGREEETDAWLSAVFLGEAVPAVAAQHHIQDLQHWIDLSA
jgi:hypothetical protein